MKSTQQLIQNEIYKISGAGPLDGVKAAAKKVYDGADNLAKTIYNLPWGLIVFYTGLAAAAGATHWVFKNINDGNWQYSTNDNDRWGFEEFDVFDY